MVARDRIEGGVPLAQPQAAAGDHADAAPGVVVGLEHARHRGAGMRVAVGGDGAPVGVLDLGPALAPLPHGGEDALGEVGRFEAGDHDGHRERARDRFVLGCAHDGADVPGRQEGLYPVAWRGEDGAHGARHADVRRHEAEIGEAAPLGLEHGHGVGRRGGLEADGEEDDLAVGVRSSQLDRVERRVHHAHVAAGGAHAEQVRGAARNAQHVAEAGEDDPGARGDGQGAVDHLQRRDAHRAAGTVHQGDRGRQELVQPAAHDGVRLPAADLHEHHRLGGQRVDVAHEAAHEGGVAEAVEAAHGASRPFASASVRRSARVCAASSSLSRLIAKPTCTSTQSPTPASGV